MGELRALSVSQQVGLLFVVLFGLLGVVTIVGVWRSLRELTPEQTALREIGPDPSAYRQKLRSELMQDAEFRKEFMASMRAEATTKPSSVTSLPNLARAPGSASGPRDDWPTTDAEIFADVTRRRA